MVNVRLMDHTMIPFWGFSTSEIVRRVAATSKSIQHPDRSSLSSDCIPSCPPCDLRAWPSAHHAASRFIHPVLSARPFSRDAVLPQSRRLDRPRFATRLGAGGRQAGRKLSSPGRA